MKLVYFDESTVTDYLTILNNGTLLQISNDQIKTQKSANMEANLGIAPRLSKLFSSFLNVGLDVDGKIGKSADKLIQKSITNALLSDFLTEAGNQQGGLRKLENYTVFPEKNSIAYYQTISPYLSMTEGDFDIGDGIRLSISKMYESLKFSKGYYEMLASDKKTFKVFRFNNEAFSNNYNVADLEQMRLSFWGFRVGEMNRRDLDFQQYMDRKVSGEVLTTFADNQNKDLLEVYDIVLAGVEEHG